MRLVDAHDRSAARVVGLRARQIRAQPVRTEEKIHLDCAQGPVTYAQEDRARARCACHKDLLSVEDLRV